MAVPIGSAPTTLPADNKPRRFHGPVRLDQNRFTRDAGRMCEEIIHHLASQLGAEVELVPGCGPKQLNNKKNTRFTLWGLDSFDQ